MFATNYTTTAPITSKLKNQKDIWLRSTRNGKDATNYDSWLNNIKLFFTLKNAVQTNIDLHNINFIYC